MTNLSAARNGKPPWATKAFVGTVREFKHLDIVSSGIFTVEFHDKHLRGWMKQALTTLKEATEVYIVEVIAKSHC